MEFNGFEDERMFLESWFTKCDENSINICRDMPGAYAGLITHECMNTCVSKQPHEHAHVILTQDNYYNCKFFVTVICL